MTTMIDDALERASGALRVARTARLSTRNGITQHVRRIGKVEVDPTLQERAAVQANALTDLSGEEQINSFLAGIRHRSLLDAMMAQASIVPDGLGAVQLASGVLAADVNEGAMKPITRATLDNENFDRHTIAGLLVASEKLLKFGGAEADKLIESELQNAVVKAANDTIINALTTSSTSGTGDALGDLSAGLAAVADSPSYIVAMAPSDARELSVATDGRTGVQGGKFAEGITVIGVEGVTNMLVIPAGLYALQDHGSELSRSRAPAIEMADDATGESGELVSMFQTNSVAFLFEREFSIYAGANAVEVT